MGSAATRSNHSSLRAMSSGLASSASAHAAAYSRLGDEIPYSSAREEDPPDGVVGDDESLCRLESGLGVKGDAEPEVEFDRARPRANKAPGNVVGSLGALELRSGVRNVESRLTRACFKLFSRVLWAWGVRKGR